MIPIEQTKFHVPNEVTGNCMAACVASIFELELEDVPTFEDTDPQELLLRKWCESQGIELVRFDREYCFNSFYLAVGPSPRNKSMHMVVMQNGICQHDPHPDGNGITAVHYMYIFIPKNPAKLVSHDV